MHMCLFSILLLGKSGYSRREILEVHSSSSRSNVKRRDDFLSHYNTYRQTDIFSTFSQIRCFKRGITHFSRYKSDISSGQQKHMVILWSNWVWRVSYFHRDQYRKLCIFPTQFMWITDNISMGILSPFRVDMFADYLS